MLYRCLLVDVLHVRRCWAAANWDTPDSRRLALCWRAALIELARVDVPQQPLLSYERRLRGWPGVGVSRVDDCDRHGYRLKHSLADARGYQDGDVDVNGHFLICSRVSRGARVLGARRPFHVAITCIAHPAQLNPGRLHLRVGVRQPVPSLPGLLLDRGCYGRVWADPDAPGAVHRRRRLHLCDRWPWWPGELVPGVRNVLVHE